MREWTGERVPHAFTGRTLKTNGHILYLQTNTLKELYLNVCKTVFLNLLFLSYLQLRKKGMIPYPTNVCAVIPR